jgi:hypothetical protein
MICDGSGGGGPKGRQDLSLVWGKAEPTYPLRRSARTMGRAPARSGLAGPIKIAKPKRPPIVREKAVETCNAGSRRSASLVCALLRDAFLGLRSVPQPRCSRRNQASNLVAPSALRN